MPDSSDLRHRSRSSGVTICGGGESAAGQRISVRSYRRAAPSIGGHRRVIRSWRGRQVGHDIARTPLLAQHTPTRQSEHTPCDRSIPASSGGDVRALQRRTSATPYQRPKSSCGFAVSNLLYCFTGGLGLAASRACHREAQDPAWRRRGVKPKAKPVTAKPPCHREAPFEPGGPTGSHLLRTGLWFPAGQQSPSHWPPNCR